MFTRINSSFEIISDLNNFLFYVYLLHQTMQLQRSRAQKYAIKVLTLIKVIKDKYNKGTVED